MSGRLRRFGAGGKGSRTSTESVAVAGGHEAVLRLLFTVKLVSYFAGVSMMSPSESMVIDGAGRNGTAR